MNRPADPALEADAVDIGRLGGSFGFLLRMAQVQVFDAFFDALGRYGLKPGEFSVVWVIHLNPGIRQGVLARRLNIKPAHMTKLVQRLEAAGHVVRSIPDDDRRSVRLTLTPTGKAFVAAHEEEFFTYYRRYAPALSAEEFRTLSMLLRKFTGTAEPGP